MVLHFLGEAKSKQGLLWIWVSDYPVKASITTGGYTQWACNLP
jgi:hypothetical protein